MSLEVGVLWLGLVTYLLNIDQICVYTYIAFSFIVDIMLKARMVV